MATKNQKKYRVIPVPYKNVTQFATLLEKTINELEDGGYTYQLINISEKPDMVIHARKLENHPLVALMKQISHPTPEPAPLKSQKSVEVANAILDAIQKGAPRGAAEDEIISHQVKRWDSLPTEERLLIAEDIEKLSTDHAEHHRDGSPCSIPKTLANIAREVRERVKATQS